MADIAHRAWENNPRSVVAFNREIVVAAIFHDGFGKFGEVLRRKFCKLGFQDADEGPLPDHVPGAAFHVGGFYVAIKQEVMLLILRVKNILSVAYFRNRPVVIHDNL